jgi:hypothetical protein
MGNPKALFFVAFLFAVVFGVIWSVFLRPMTIQETTGVITDKYFEPEMERFITSNPNGQDFKGRSTTMKVAEGYVFKIKLDASENIVSYALNTVGSGYFEVGNKVKIKYQKKGIPFLWERIYVLEMALYK